MRSNALLKRELAAGTPIDGVGFQLHLTAAPRFADEDFRGRMKRNFRRFAELGLDIYITELDVGTYWREDQAEQFELQAEVYAGALRICLEEPACKALSDMGHERSLRLACADQGDAAGRGLLAEARVRGDAQGVRGERGSAGTLMEGGDARVPARRQSTRSGERMRSPSAPSSALGAEV